MPKSQISYTEAVCLPSNDPRFLLAISIYRHRMKHGLNVSLNVASTLLTYKGEKYQPPVVSKSTGQGKDRSRHAERLSLVTAIQYAIKDEWGPFKELKQKLPNSDILSIEEIYNNKELQEALRELDSIQIYSERAPCDYRNNQTDTNLDKGCEVYLEELGKLISPDKVHIYFSIAPFTREPGAQEQLSHQLDLMRQHEALIRLKEDIIKQRSIIEDEHLKEIKLHREKIEPLLANMRALYKEEQDPKKQQALMGEIKRIQVEPIFLLKKQKEEKYAELNARENEINRRLKTTSIHSSKTSTFPPIESLPPRKGLKNINISRFVTNSTSFKLGEAIDGGDCFFDALAQSLNTNLGANLHSAKSLRMSCHQYYLEHKQEINAWNERDYGGIDKGEEYLMVQYTKPELDQDFHGRPPIWGRPHIEGKILCRTLALEAIIVLEIIEHPDTKQLIPSFRKVTSNDDQSLEEDEANALIINSQKLPILVVSQSQLHFVPLLSNQALTSSVFLASNAQEHTPPAITTASSSSSSASTRLLALSKELESHRNVGQELEAGIPAEMHFTDVRVVPPDNPESSAAQNPSKKPRIAEKEVPTANPTDDSATTPAQQQTGNTPKNS